VRDTKSQRFKTKGPLLITRCLEARYATPRRDDSIRVQVI
jgi:hypothetical protein